MSTLASVPLNALDLAVEYVWRRLGSDLPMNIHINFRGRIDLAQLQDAADRLAARWPLLTARLVRSPRPMWVPTGAAHWPVREATTDSDSDADLRRAIYRLGGESFDVSREDPARLTVLHQPGGSDVLTLQFSHILMDGPGAVGLLQQLLDPARIPEESYTAGIPADVTETVLAKIPFRERMRALRRIVRFLASVRPLTLPLIGPARSADRDGRVTLRWIDEAAASTLRDRLEKMGPFVNPTFAVLASGCRTLSRYVQGPIGPKSAYVMWLAYNLRRGQQKRLLFQNFDARFMLIARPDELGDRDELVRRFAAQARAQLADNTTQGTLVLCRILARLTRWIPSWMGLIGPRPRTLHGSSMPELIESGRTVLGSPVDHCWISLPIIPMFGVSLTLVKSGRRLLAVFMHSPRNLSDQQAARVLDEWLDDLFCP